MSTRPFGQSAIVFALSVFTACSSTAPSSLTSADTLKVVGVLTPALSTAVVQGITSLSSMAVPGGSAQTLRQIGTAATAISAAKSTPVGSNVSCQSSGSAAVTGTALNSLDGSGNGTASINFQIGFASCSGPDVVLKTSQPLAFGGSFNFAAFKMLSPAAFTFTGVVNFTVNGQTGSLTYNCSLAIDTTTFASTTVSGTVTVQYPSGKNSTTAACIQYGIG